MFKTEGFDVCRCEWCDDREDGEYCVYGEGEVCGG